LINNNNWSRSEEVIIIVIRKVWRYQSGNQKSDIGECQTNTMVKRKTAKNDLQSTREK